MRIDVLAADELLLALDALVGETQLFQQVLGGGVGVECASTDTVEPALVEGIVEHERGRLRPVALALGLGGEPVGDLGVARSLVDAKEHRVADGLAVDTGQQTDVVTVVHVLEALALGLKVLRAIEGHRVADRRVVAVIPQKFQILFFDGSKRDVLAHEKRTTGHSYTWLRGRHMFIPCVGETVSPGASVTAFPHRTESPGMNLTDRPRRLRRDGIRGLVSETDLDASDLIAPVFVDATTDERVPIETMPGHERVPVEQAVDRVEEIRETGVEAVIVFGVPESKDADGSRAWAENGVVQEAVRRISAETDAYVITDVCLCEYTEHGHCGPLEPDAREDPTLTVDNDRTLELLGEIAVSHADAGADMVAPSGMMDGMVGAIRESLDEVGHTEVPIMSYAAKYESAFYGPFRDAADGAPAFGDRRHYQMDPANSREAMREVELDVEQGADVLMVKPALPYLDIVRDLRENFDHPVAAYNVSGEYAMLHAASEKGWLDLEETAYESLLSIKRAGADLILTYFAEDIASRL